MNMTTGSATKLFQEVKTLGRHGLTYGLAGVLSRVVGFLMIPVYTHFLTPTDYGVLELAGLAVEVIGIVVGMGLADAIYRHYYDTDDEDNRNLVISTALIGIASVGIVAVGLFGALSKPLAALVLDGPHQWVYIALSLGTLWCNQIVNLIYNYLRVRQESSSYLWLSVAKLVLTLSLNIYFVVVARAGVAGIFWSNLLAAGAFSLAVFPMVVRHTGLRFSLSLARKLLRFSLPVVPANIASMIVNASDRFFVKNYLSLADAGIYALGYKLGNVVFYFVRVPFMQIWSPRSFALYREGAPPELFARITTYFMTLMIFVGMAVAVYVKDVIRLIAPEAYWSAARYAPAVTLCYVIYSLDNQVAFGISVAKRMEYWTYVNLVVAAINIGLNFWLISRYGVWGAVAATGVALTLKIVLLHLVGRRFYRIPFEWLRMLAMCIVSVALYWISTQFRVAHVAGALLVDTLVILAFPPIVWMLGVLKEDEKEHVRRFRRRLLAKFA